jgi:hypothetical protein
MFYLIQNYCRVLHFKIPLNFHNKILNIQDVNKILNLRTSKNQNNVIRNLVVIQSPIQLWDLTMKIVKK